MNCVCKGIRTCLICENEKKDILKSSTNSLRNNVEYGYCFLCNCAWKNEDPYIVVENHPNHHGEQLMIEGVHIVPEFITDSEEENLIKSIDSIKWIPSQSGRMKQDFGPKVNFKKRKIKMDNFCGFPTFISFLLPRLQNISILSDFVAVELCNLDYNPERGSSIDSHLDDSWLWGERLVTINLLSDTILTLSSISKSINENADSQHLIHVPLYRRSLIVLHKDVRYSWYHAIFRKYIKCRRLAMTFRELAKEFLPGGKEEAIGKNLLACVHCESNIT